VKGGRWYRDDGSGERFWIQQARADGTDRAGKHKRGSFPVAIDDDARPEYWADRWSRLHLARRGGDGGIAAVPPDWEYGDGFELYLVDILAQRWGSTNDGKTGVWAELARSHRQRDQPLTVRLVGPPIARYAGPQQTVERVVPSTGPGRDTGRWTSMSTLKQLQGDVAARMRRGDTFASVEAEVIDPSGLSDDEKAALWLYGWSFVHWRRQRREAMAHRVADTPGCSWASACGRAFVAHSGAY